MNWFRPKTNAARIDKLLREHERLHNDYKFASDFFIGHLRGERERARLAERMAQIKAEVEELERAERP